MTPPIYLDYNATTPVAPEVADAMQPFLREAFGNPSSSHWYGRCAHDAIADARKNVAMLIGAQPEEIIFTGCATEANNLALRGIDSTLREKRRHIIISSVEHPAILEPALWLRARGWEVSIVPVDHQGWVDPADVKAALRDDTALVSIMHANNEVGTIQPIAEIAALAHERGALMHSDAAQTPGKIAVDVNELQVDLLSLAGHKFYAAKGVGALYIRNVAAIKSDLQGAGQEQGLRPGTENVPAIVGLGMAAQLASTHLPRDQSRLRHLRDEFHRLLQRAIPDLTLNGHESMRLPNTLNVSFPRISGRDLLRAVDDVVAASLGSACHSESDTVSGVIAAMHIGPTRAMGAVRFSVGRYSTHEDITRAAEALVTAWKRLAED